MVFQPAIAIADFLSTVHYKVHVNYREKVIRNGSCLVSWHGIKLGYIYAIVDTDGSVITVLRKGILSRFIFNNMEQNLIEALQKLENQTASKRWLCANHIDSPIQ